MDGQATSVTLPEVAPVPMKRGLSAALAAKYGLDQAKFLNTVKATCFPKGGEGISNEQLAAFLIVANEYDLNPFIRQIYAFPGKEGGVIPIVPIDGWSKIVNEHPQADGSEFVYENQKGELIAITCKMYRKDRAHPIEVTEFLSECTRDTVPWNQWPHRMLRHKAYIQAARLAFGLSGIFDPDEAERIQEVEDTEVEIVGAADQYEAEQKRVAEEEPQAEPEEILTPAAKKEKAKMVADILHKLESPALSKELVDAVKAEMASGSFTVKYLEDTLENLNEHLDRALADQDS